VLDLGPSLQAAVLLILTGHRRQRSKRADWIADDILRRSKGGTVEAMQMNMQEAWPGPRKVRQGMPRPELLHEGSGSRFVHERDITYVGWC